MLNHLRDIKRQKAYTGGGVGETSMLCVSGSELRLVKWREQNTEGANKIDVMEQENTLLRYVVASARVDSAEAKTVPTFHLPCSTVPVNIIVMQYPDIEVPNSTDGQP